MAHSSNETQTSLPNLLLDYLKQLTDKELEEFKLKLTDTKYKELKPLPRGLVMDLGRTGLADKMISYYGKVDALSVMHEILNMMNLRDLAKRLHEELQKETMMSERPKPSAARGRKRKREEEEKREKVRDTIMLKRPKPSGAQERKRREEEEKREKDRDEELDVFDLKKFIRADKEHWKLLLLVKNSRTALLNSCDLTDENCEVLTSALRSNSSPLRELDLSDNDLQDSGVKLLSAGLEDLHCKLEILRLSGCRVTEKGCSFLASALRSNPSHLRELDLSYNHPGASGLKLLSAVLKDPNCKLEKLNVEHSGECRTRPGVQKYSCQLTLDPNTANRYLSLSEENRKVTEKGEEQPYPNRSERFDNYTQVLCRESLTDRCYWEAEWAGDGAWIGVTYKGIRRKGESKDCELGANNKSWILWCRHVSYSVWHNNKRTDIPIEPSGSRKVGVYLDWGAGALSFYRVSSDGLTLLYRFTSSFTEPLYPGFMVLNSSVSL